MDGSLLRLEAPAPLQVFDVEDAEGPLEGAQHDISATFGRLKLADAARMGLPQQQLQGLAAEQEQLAAQPSDLKTDLLLWRQHLGTPEPPGGDVLCYGSVHVDMLKSFSMLGRLLLRQSQGTA